MYTLRITLTNTAEHSLLSYLPVICIVECKSFYFSPGSLEVFNFRQIQALLDRRSLFDCWPNDIYNARLWNAYDILKAPLCIFCTNRQYDNYNDNNDNNNGNDNNNDNNDYNDNNGDIDNNVILFLLFSCTWFITKLKWYSQHVLQYLCSHFT